LELFQYVARGDDEYLFATATCYEFGKNHPYFERLAKPNRIGQ
jgi:alpha-D-ribose 1-methylphosphonate 5-triphosphate synthase subunit PhnI